MRILTKAGIQALENKTAAEGKTTFDEMMRLAGTGAAQLLKERFSLQNRKAVVVCGSGNNGGDGFVCAGKLRENTADVCVVLACGKPRTPLAKAAYERMDPRIPVIDFFERPDEAGETILNADCLIDAVFGFGFHGEFPENLRILFRKMNESPAKKLALDLPSGLACDSGSSACDVFKADITAVFTAKKPVHILPKSRGYCGECVIVPVGISPEDIHDFDGYEVLDLNTVIANWKQRVPESHKGTYGRLFALAGSFGMAGAAMMAAKAAQRCGVGLLELASEKEMYPVLAPVLPEAVFCLYGNENTIPVAQGAERASAVLVGCGLSQSPTALSALSAALKNAAGPVVIDADGINLIASHTDILIDRKTPVVLTPHPKEAARLLATDVTRIQTDRRAAAAQIARTFNAICVLKGTGTVIASPEGAFYLNPTGNPGMAKGGSGDALAGMIGAFLAQGTEPFYAAALGAYLHGYAGDLCAEKYSQTAMLPNDLIETLPEVFKMIERQCR